MLALRRWFLMSLAVAICAPGIGALLRGLWPITLLLIVTSFLWLRTARVAISLTLYIAALGLAVWLNMGMGWLLVGMVSLLAAWDLDAFNTRIKQAPHIEHAPRLIDAHLQRLAVVSLMGLLLGAAGLLIRVQLSFGLTLIAALLAALGMAYVLYHAISAQSMREIMSRQQRNRLLVVWIVTLVVLLTLAALLPNLTLLPERTYAVPQVTKSAKLALDLTWLFIAALAIYIIGFVLLAPKLLRERLTYVLIGLGLLALLIIGLIALADKISIEQEPLALIPEATPTLSSSETITPEPEQLPDLVTFTPPPWWVGQAVALGIALMVAIGLLGAIWQFHLLQQTASNQPLTRLAAHAQAALVALYGGEDAGDVVLRCYYEMARVLDQTQGIRRVETVTPREFAAQLTALGLPADAVHTLTQLFEDARYGATISDALVAQQAVASLEAISAACQENV